MKPGTIEITNIGPYEHEIVHFPDGVTCITGKNGVGKSYIVDALLLALYGESSKAGEKELDNYKPDNGALEGQVIATFEHFGHTYRAERSRNFAKDKTVAKLLIATAEKGKWENYGGKGIKETRRAVESLVKLDYSGIVNSCIVLQKDMESFANLSDTGRKEFYAKALQLQLWDLIDEREKKKLDALQKSLVAWDTKIKSIIDTIACKAHHEERKAQFTAELAEKTAELVKLEASISELAEKLSSRKTLEEKKSGLEKELAAEQKKVTELEERVAAIRKSIAHAEQKIADLEKVLSQRAAIEQAIAAEAQIAPQIVACDQKQKTYQELQRKLRDLEGQSATWEKQLAIEKAQVERASAIWEKTRAQERSRLETELKQAQAQDMLINEVPCDDEIGRQCKLLSAAWKARDSIASLQQKIQVLAAQNSPHIAAGQELCYRMNPHAALIDETQMKLDLAGYDSAKHEELKKELEDLRKLSSQMAALDAAQERKTELADQIAQSKIDIEKLEQQIETAVSRIAEISTEKAQVNDQYNALSPLSFQLSQKQIEQKRLREEEASLTGDLGKVEANLERIANAQAELDQVREETKDSRRKITAIEKLRAACNKKGGVPALVIENALPQIEARANAFLEGIQGGRFQIRFDTQPEVKSTGELSEACRIIVMDNGRERPYKTYSGAEAFLLNFALRIGNSQFLAHRASAEIKFLVLDEGLGALDPDNLQAVKEAIQRAADIFGKVLLITHIQELWDAFPQRIEVYRDGNGSKVRIVA